MSRSPRGLPRLLILLAVLALAALACGPLSGIMGDATEAPADAPTSAPADSPTEAPAEAPTEAASGPSGGGNGLTRSNVNDLDLDQSWEAADLTVLTVASFDPTNPTRLFTFGADSDGAAWDISSEDVIYGMNDHTDYVWSASFSPDGSVIATGGSDFRVRLWDVETGEVLRTLNTNSGGYRSAWSPDGNLLAVVGEPVSRIEIYNVTDGTRQFDADTPSDNPFYGVAWSSDGSWLVGSNSGNAIVVFDPNDNFSVMESFITEGTGWDLEFSPDLSILAVCGVGGWIEFYNTAGWRSQAAEKAYPTQCSDGVFTADGSLYLSVGDDSLIIWDPVAGTQLRRIGLERFGWWVSLSADERSVAVADDKGRALVYSLP